MLKKRYQVLLLAIAILAAYYPAVLSGFSEVDDANLYRSFIGRQDGWNLRSIFIPTGSEGLYYRPLLLLSFVFDRQLHGLSPSLMHLENILLHLGNACLVFLLTWRLLPRSAATTFTPLFAGLFFGLHPVLAESTNWISGRTDLLAGMFVLLGALLIIRYKESGSVKYIFFALLAILLGVLSKETALAFLPAAVLLIAAKTREESSNSNDNQLDSRADRYQFNAWLILGTILIAGFFYLLRSSAFSSYSHRITITKAAIASDWVYSFMTALRSFGFYVKKFFLPYPLNFAIMEVDPLYEILAVPILALCLLLMIRNTIHSAILAASLFLLSPAVIIAFGQIAWTPYAERYMYISSAFAVVYLAVLLYHTRLRIPLSTILIIVALLAMFATTLQRSIVWADDEALCRDTVQKSPQARDIRATYGGILAMKGKYDAALEQFQIGKALPLPYYDPRFDIGIGYVHDKQGQYDEAIRDTETAFNKSHGTSSIALQNLIAMLEEKEKNSGNRKQAPLIREQIIDYQEKLYNLTRDPKVLFAIAVDETNRHKRDSALFYFHRVESLVPLDDPLKKLTQIKIMQLNSNK